MCLFYETKQDLLETAVAFFEAGLRDNEFCLWAVSAPTTVDEARKALAESIPQFERYESEGRIEIVASQDWYLKENEFDRQRVGQLWVDKIAYALERGFDGLRASGNAFWLQTPLRDAFLEYECGVDQALSGLSMIVLCTYQIEGSRGEDLVEVVHTHKTVVARRKNAWQAMDLTELPVNGKSLTERELEVISWVARGKSAWEIGTILDITKRTVDEHVKVATRKLGASNRTEAVALAVRRRIIAP